MEARSGSHWLFLLFGLFYLTITLQVVQGIVESEGPSESECRPFIEKALKELEIGQEPSLPSEESESKEDLATVEITTEDDSLQHEGESEATAETEDDEDTKSAEDQKEEEQEGSKEDHESLEDTRSGEDRESAEDARSDEGHAADAPEAADDGSEEDQDQDDQADHDGDQTEDVSAEEEPAKESEEERSAEAHEGEEGEEEAGDAEKSEEEQAGVLEESKEEEHESMEEEEDRQESVEEDQGEESQESVEYQAQTPEEESIEEHQESVEDQTQESVEEQPQESAEKQEEEEEVTKHSAEEEVTKHSAEEEEVVKESVEESKESAEDVKEPEEDTKESAEETKEGSQEEAVEAQKEEEKPQADEPQVEETEPEEVQPEETQDDEAQPSEETEEREEAPEEELTIEDEIPEELRPTDHIAQLLKLNEENEDKERMVNNVAEITLRDLKRLYENAIKPLETLYKYRDLSNRHFGDAEIFSKPLVLFMGPWSGGKSSIINYLVDNEYNETSLRTGAEPSPAYFNIMMYGNEAEVLDGTQLAADFTFSGLQKFGQGLEERLRGMKLPKKLLEKINIVEIPGILEVRKQISRVFPFNDACQWFIDRADIIFLVYDPSKLDVGPETEAILDQLKGREHQTRIILNKADQVKPEELMRVQGALIWNISPLMSSAQPPAMYTTSLWSRPYEPWAPVRLLQAQERAFLRDLRTAVDKRIENRIASARRFAVRVRNHAKMVDCYLTTYYNHKSVFGNRKQVSDAIIEHPQDYHIYEGLSTLTNISRYDLPDPDVYRDFFRLNPLYDFQQLSATCTYFRGCPINRLDVAIAYDLPELVGKYKKMVEEALSRANLKTPAS